MTKEEILKDDWVANNYGDRARNWIDPAFLDGVNWMEDRMQESNEGKALLYAVEKTAERTKREVIYKAVEWIKSQMYIENIFEYDKDNQPVRYVCASCCDTVDDFIEKFKQAMEEEL